MRLRATVAAVIGALVLVSGCSGGDGNGTDDGQPSASGSAAPDAAAGTDEEGTDGDGTEDVVVEPSGAAVPEVGEPAGKRQIVYQGWTMTLEVFPLARDSGGLVLNARLTYDKAGKEGSSPPGDMLSADGAFSQATGAPNGFVLVDKPAGKAYLPAVNESSTRLCSPDLRFNDAVPGDQVYVSCLFGAPPESTTEVDVRAAKFGVFTGVPLQ